MTRKTKRGIGLRPSPSEKEKNTDWLIKGLVSAAASLVMIVMGNGLSIFPSGIAFVVMEAVAVTMCGTWAVLRKAGKESWFYLGSLGVAFLLVASCRSYLIEGFRIFWNQAGERILENTGIVTQRWLLRLDAPERCALFFGGFVALGISLVCCCLTSVSPVLLAGLLPVALLAGSALMGESGASFWMVTVLSVSVLLFLYGGWNRNSSATPVVISWCVCVALGGLLLAALSAPAVAEWGVGIRENVQRDLHDRQYETPYTILPEGDFSHYTGGKNSEQALVVTMEIPQQMYLRGFTAAVFTGTDWKPLEKEALAKNKQLLYWLNQNTFDLNAQFEAAASGMELRRGSVTVQNIGACSYYRYVPFSIVEGAWCQPENLNTDGVYAQGERSYAYAVTAGTGETVQQVLEHLQNSDDPQVLAYRKAESGYRRFIYNYYLQIPQEVLELLKDLWDQIAEPYGGADNLTVEQAQECVVVFLEECFPEDGTPEELELPLESVAGSSYQYATVAAMTLRYFGIPARYAEGYVISREMSEGMESGQTLQVTGSCAMAWVEVYQDGIGWIPMSLAPGMGEMLENPDKEGIKTNISNQNATERQEEEPEKEPEPDGGTLASLVAKSVLATMIVGLIFALLAFLVCVWRRRIRLKRRNARYTGESCRESSAWIYADTAVLLEQLGFDRGNGSMRGLYAPLMEKYGEEYALCFTQATDLNDRAVFSAEGMEESQRDTLLEFRNQTLEKLRGDLKWYKRFWLKWVRCLY